MQRDGVTGSEPSRERAPVAWLPLTLALAAALALATGGWASDQGADGRPGPDRQGLVTVEQEWLGAKDASTLERILAPDYVHVIPGAGFITREQQIAWFKSHPVPPGVERRFEDLHERIYGDVGIVDGVVVQTTPEGAKPHRTLFTDVFVYQDGRWRAVNSEENEVP